MAVTQRLSLTDKALLAAFDCSKGDLQTTFAGEEIVVAAWKQDKQAWGLRKFENDYPDSNKIYTKLDGDAGLVAKGFLEKVGERIYRLTPVGLSAASSLKPEDKILQTKAGRELHEPVKRILEHPVFQLWLNDPTKPKHFREAGHFWGIAPGTPPRTVRARVRAIEQILKMALEALAQKGVEQIADQRGKLLFDRHDIERCLQFQIELKKRFDTDLHRLLKPEDNSNKSQLQDEYRR